MAERTPIEWTDATWNPIGGCSIKSPGCANCYAMKLAGTRLRNHPLYAGTTDHSKAGPVFNGHLTALPAEHPSWTWPLRWAGAEHPVLGPGMPSLIFVGDMADLFHEDRPMRDVTRVVETIARSKHIGQLLTKRPAAMWNYFKSRTGLPELQRRLWVGCSVEDQARADERCTFMRALSMVGFTTFVSYEPALERVDWCGWEFLDQLISGGESGRGARPSHPDWHRAARDFCAAQDIAYLFKQWGTWVAEDHEAARPYVGCGAELGKDLILDDVTYVRVGKKLAGRQLDGREWKEFPKVAA